MNASAKKTPLLIEGLKSITTYIELISGLVANIAAGYGWVSGHLSLLRLPSRLSDKGLFFSIALSFLAIAGVWQATLNKGKGLSLRAQVSRTIVTACVALVGFLVTAVLFEVADALWKKSSLQMAELLVRIALPFLFGLGHAFLAAFLCCLGILFFAPGFGLLRRQL